MTKRSRSLVLGIKERIGIRLFRFANIERIHIIGCSRSGTTMLQFAMIAFARTIITNGETGIGSPYLKERLRLLLRYSALPGRKYLVTKRDRGWFWEAEVKALLQRVPVERVGLILIVRDPRDVLTSRHLGSAEDRPWVTPKHWYDSIKAGERIFEELANYPLKVAIRYEDLVCAPEKIEEEFGAVFGFEKKKEVSSIRELRTNIDKMDYAISPEMLVAMHRLRDMDENAVQRWAKTHQNDPFALDDETIQAKLFEFMETWGYSTPVNIESGSV